MNWGILLSALMAVESGGDPFAHNKAEDARGVLQIRKIMVADVNRIYSTTYKHNQCWDEDTSIMLCVLYLRHYGADSYEAAARSWVGGPNGMTKPSTFKYWMKVQREIQRIETKKASQ